MSDLIESIPRELSPEETERLTDDLSTGIHKPETIAARYGFRDVGHLKKHLHGHAWIAEAAARRKAILESDRNTGERVVLKSQFGVEETIPSMVGIALNPDVHPKDRIDAFKELRQAGAVGASKDKGAAAAGTQFSLTIHMPGGKQEKLVTTVVEQLPAPIGDEC